MKGEALGEASGEVARRTVGIIGVIAVVLAGHQHMQSVMDVVVPLCGVARRPAVCRPGEWGRLVRIVFENQMNVPVSADACLYGVGQLGQEQRASAVVDGVNRIEAQAVDKVLFDPIEGVGDEEAADDVAVRTVEGDRGAPGRVGVGLEERPGVGADVVPLRPEVVVDDVEEDHQPALVRRVDQRLQVVGPAVGGIGGEQGGAVVSPVAGARKVGDRHQLDGGDAKIDQIIEFFDAAGERAGGSERADVQLVEDDLLPRPAAPVGMAPAVGGRIDHLAGAMHVVRLRARGGIGNQQIAVDAKPIAGAGTNSRDDELVPTAIASRHGDLTRGITALQAEFDALGIRRPQAEADAVADDLGAERRGEASSSGATAPASAAGAAAKSCVCRLRATGRWHMNCPAVADRSDP